MKYEHRETRTKQNFRREKPKIIVRQQKHINTCGEEIGEWRRSIVKLQDASGSPDPAQTQVSSLKTKCACPNSKLGAGSKGEGADS